MSSSTLPSMPCSALMIASAAPDDAVLFLDRARIKGIGQDAVTVDGEGDLEPFANAGRAREVVDSGIHLRGANVLTEGGDSSVRSIRYW